jgi:8-hydroxy-5-deazaflavin:NADPH oxidoreductase
MGALSVSASTAAPSKITRHATASSSFLQGWDSVKVTIVGAGNMGRGIGTRVVAGGHQVEIVDHDPADAGQLAGDLGGSATAVEPDAPFGGEVVVFAVYYPGIKDAVRQYADQLAGKVVVDITNPLNTETWDSLATAPGSS